MNERRKPACIFYIVKDIGDGTVSRCILSEVDNKISKFDIYGGWNKDRAAEFVLKLRGCPFISTPELNLFKNQLVRERCDKCSKRLKWISQHKEEIEVQCLEDRGF